MSEPLNSYEPAIPLLVDGMIDDATFTQLLADLANFASEITVRQKTGATTLANEGSLSLEDAGSRLRAGQTAAIQITYNFDRSEWTDTIMRLPTGYRVVRCRHEP